MARGWSHCTQPIYTHAREQVLNVEEARWAPGPARMRKVKRISGDDFAYLQEQQIVFTACGIMHP